MNVWLSIIFDTLFQSLSPIFFTIRSVACHIYKFVKSILWKDHEDSSLGIPKIVEYLLFQYIL